MHATHLKEYTMSNPRPLLSSATVLSQAALDKMRSGCEAQNNAINLAAIALGSQGMVIAEAMKTLETAIAKASLNGLFDPIKLEKDREAAIAAIAKANKTLF